MLKTIQREKHCYPRGFFKEINGIFNEKMPQIQTQIDKNTRKYGILKILSNFCLFFEKLRGLECQRQKIRIRFVVWEASLKK